MGVSESIQPDNFDLLPGMARLRSDIAGRLARSRGGRSESRQRNTVAEQPYGDRGESIVGDVANVETFDLPSKLRVGSDSVLAGILRNSFPRLQVTQITILVDDVLNDPDAVDVMSYTVWCPADKAPAGLAMRRLVSVQIAPVEFLSIGRVWLVESIEQM